MMYVIQILHGFISKSNGYTRKIDDAAIFSGYHAAHTLARLCGGQAMALATATAFHEKREGRFI